MIKFIEEKGITVKRSIPKCSSKKKFLKIGKQVANIVII